jgi:hypothetical protein
LKNINKLKVESTTNELKFKINFILMTKKYLLGLSLIAISFWLVGSVCLAATVKPAKTKVDPGITKFVKIWAQAKVVNDKIGVLIQDSGTQMSALDSSKGWAAELKITNKALTEVNTALTLINKQNVTLASLKKTAGTIKNADIKSKGQLLAQDYIDIYKPLKDMINQEKAVLVILKNNLTLQSKGKPTNPDDTAKINALQTKITDDTTSLTTLSGGLQAAQTDFEAAAGVTLAK